MTFCYRGGNSNTPCPSSNLLENSQNNGSDCVQRGKSFSKRHESDWSVLSVSAEYTNQIAELRDGTAFIPRTTSRVFYAENGLPGGSSWVAGKNENA